MRAGITAGGSIWKLNEVAIMIFTIEIVANFGIVVEPKGEWVVLGVRVCGWS